MYNTFNSFACLGVLIVLAHLIGRRAVGFMHSSLENRLQHFLICQAIGFAILSYSIFIFGLCGAINERVFIGFYFVALPLLFSKDIWSLAKNFNKQNIHSYRNFFTNLSLLSKVLCGAFFVLLIMNVLRAFLPPIGRDALSYHLAMPQRYVAMGIIRPNPANFYSYFPALIEMLYTFALLVSNDYSAQFIHCYYGVLTALAIFSFARQFGTKRAAFVCVLSFYSLPLVSQLSGWAYVDLALCFYSILALGLFSSALQEHNKKLLMLSAILFGCALSIKYLALISLYCALAIMLIAILKDASMKQRMPKKNLFYFFLIAGIIGCPFYLRNIITTGNPLYPFFYGIFGGPHWDIEKATLYDTWLRNSFSLGHQFVDYLLLVFRVSFLGKFDGPFDGTIGPLYLFLSPLLIFYRPKQKSFSYMFLYAALFFFAWINISQQLRFLLPCLAALSICLTGIFETKKKMFLQNSILTITALLIACNITISVQNLKKYQPLEFLTGKISREQFLQKHLRNYPAIAYANTHLDATAKAYMVSMSNIGYYCEFPFFQEHVFEDYTFKKIITESSSSQEIYAWFHNNGFTHILINETTSARFLYPDLPTQELKRYQTFCQHYLTKLYSDENVCLYQIAEQPAD